MLDALFGRKQLKTEIDELTAEIDSLEEEIDSLEEEIELEQRRRKEAVTEKQEAQRQVNRMEDRIEQLEDRVERLQSEDTGFTYRQKTTIDGKRLNEILNRLDSIETGPEGALTAYLDNGRDLPREVREAFGERAALVSRAAPCVAVSDDAGIVGACLRPPISPEPFSEWSDQFTFERSWFQPRGRYTLALVRSDLFAMGTYQGDERVSFHGFDSELKSQHSKGGFSQARFERLRNEQIDEHLDRCLAAVEEREADPLYVVGDRSVLGEFMHLAAETKAVDATGKPETALRSAWEQFWTVQFRVI